MSGIHEKVCIACQADAEPASEEEIQQFVSSTDWEGHHPKIITEWGSVKVYWWSHKIKKIHLNDLILAARCDVGFSSI